MFFFNRIDYLKYIQRIFLVESIDIFKSDFCINL